MTTTTTVEQIPTWLTVSPVQLAEQHARVFHRRLREPQLHDALAAAETTMLAGDRTSA